jgi:hypothetical protein
VNVLTEEILTTNGKERKQREFENKFTERI